MFVVLLRFSGAREKAGSLMAGSLMDAHRAWLRRGFDDGVFLLAGSLRPDAGGVILAHGTSLAELRDRVDADPFVAEDVVEAEILDIAPAKADPRLEVLLG